MGGVIAALLGVYFVFCISKWIDTLLPRFVKNMLILIGSNTLIFFPLTEYIPQRLEWVIVSKCNISGNLIVDMILKILAFLICYIIIYWKTMIKRNVAIKRK